MNAATAQQQSRINELLSSLTLDELKKQYGKVEDLTVAQWILDELERRLPEGEFIEFCENY